MELTIDSELEYWRARKLQSCMYVYILEVKKSFEDVEGSEDEMAEMLSSAYKTLDILLPAMLVYEEENNNEDK